MAHHTNSAGGQQPCEDQWTEFSEYLTSLPYEAASDFTGQDLLFTEHTLPQPNATYDLTSDDYSWLAAPVTQPGANYVPADAVNLFDYKDSNQSFPEYSQPPFAFDMDTSPAIPNAFTNSAGPEADQVPLRSPEHPDSKSDSLQKESTQQLNKTDNPQHTCPIPSCPHPNFTSKTCLDRHKREVHQRSKMHFCPMASCKRQQKGFPRKYNLFGHMKRCHPNSNPKEQNDTEGEEEESMGSGDVIVTSDGRVKEEWERLCQFRAELDGDIRALERTMSLVGDSAS